MKKQILGFFALCCLALGCGHGEHETHDHNPETPIITNDISNQRVTSFAEDMHGHIWIGTFRGLNRFNVHEYHQHFCTGSESTIPDNQVQYVFKESRDRLWISTVNGMALYTEQDDFRRIPMDTRSRNAVQILEDHAGRIYINTIVEIAVYDEISSSFVTVLSIVDGSIPSILQCFVSENALWVASTDAIRKYDPVSYDLISETALPGYYSYFGQLQDGQLWMCGPEGVSVYDMTSGNFAEAPKALVSHELFGQAQVSYIYTYGNYILLNTDKHGLFCFDLSTGLLYHQDEQGFPFDVPDEKITCMFVDSRDNLWIGTYDKGYHVVYAYEERFNTDSWLKSSLGNKSVVSLANDSKGNLWISTLKDGLYLYNSSSELFKQIDLGRALGVPTLDLDVSNVFVDRDDKVWLSTNNGVVRCKVVDDGLVMENSWTIFMSMAISQDMDGRVWVGSMGEMVSYISPEDDKLHSVKAVSAPFTFTPYCLPLNDGTVLSASFEYGFSLIDGKENHVRQLAIDPNVWKDCIQRSVFVPSCMHQTSDGVVWVGTLANGLFKYDLAKNEFEHVSGAPCLDITAIEEDNSGNLWVSTQYGLGNYDRNAEKFTNWFADDGIGGNQFYDRASCTLPEGTIIFGGTHGLTIFDPQQVTLDRVVPVYFEDLKIHNVLVRPGEDSCLPKSLAFCPEINLEYAQNCFSISFAALEYSEYERVEYQYMLEGFDGHWIDAHNNREAYYSNIPAGKYKFKVRVLNHDGSLVLAENVIPVTINAAWWFSWWAILIYMLIIAGIFYLIVKARRKIAAEKLAKVQAQQEKEQEKKVNQMNMSFFANVSHEFRTPLTMISGPVSQLEESPEMTEDNRRLLNIVQRNIHRMQRLVNQQLDFNKLENDTLKLSVRQVDVIAQLSNLTDVFRMNAEEKGITFKAYGLEDSVKAWVDDDKLDKICFNLLSNALKFTPYGGKVEFSLDVISHDEAAGLFPLTVQDVDTRYLKIAVRDSGTGIPADQLEKVFERYYQGTAGKSAGGNGIGLSIVKKILDLHSARFGVESEEGKGSRFWFALPLEFPKG